MWAFIQPYLKALLDRLPEPRAAKIDNLDAAVGSRATPAQVNTEVHNRLNAAAPSSPTAGSVYAWLKSLFDSYTPTRAGKLDNLDATVSGRAPASTALSTAVWTNTHAGRLDASVSSRAPASTALSNTVWTSTHAGRLDTTIGSRAPASTALSTAVWTNARGAKLDNLDTAVSSARMPAPRSTFASRVYTADQYDIVRAGTTRVYSGTNTSGAWVDVLNVSGSGVLEYLAFSLQSASGVTAGLRLIVDGVVAHSYEHSVGGSVGCVLIGDANQFQAVPFYESLKIQRKDTHLTYGATIFHYRYYA